jgi:hypothetical protein
VPFVRFSRDKRGYEHTYLVHDSGGRGRPGRMRVLYWFRTPPGIKVGREPFDDEARRQIESRNPGIAFDWNAIASTPMPPVPEVEHWRERRRVERAAKVARREEEQEAEHVEPEQAEAPTPLLVAEPVALETAADPAAADAPPALPITESQVGDSAPKKRRRRRGGRRRRSGAEPVVGADAHSGTDTDAGAETDIEDGEVASSDDPLETVAIPAAEPAMNATRDEAGEAESASDLPADSSAHASKE